MLREYFLSADLGISGANFLIVETGSVALVTNEGNGRMATTLPRVHVAITGIEKVAPTPEDLSTLNRVLPRSAAGQEISNYFSILTGPRAPPCAVPAKRSARCEYRSRAAAQAAREADRAAAAALERTRRVPAVGVCGVPALALCDAQPCRSDAATHYGRPQRSDPASAFWLGLDVEARHAGARGKNLPRPLRAARPRALGRMPPDIFGAYRARSKGTCEKRPPL